MGGLESETMKKNIILIVVIMSIIADQLFAKLPESKHFKLEKLADGVYATIHKIGGHAIGNAGIINLGDKTVIFDTFISPIAAKELLKVVKELNLSPIAYVINSHYHNVRIRGNQVFDDNVIIISTHLTRELIAKNEPEQIKQEKTYAKDALAKMDSLMKAEEDPSKKEAYLMWFGYYEALVESHPILKTRLPELTFDQELVIHGSEKTAELISYGSGHTESDLILYLPSEKIAFMGDLVFIEMHPYMGDGNPDHWVEYLNKVKDLDIEIVVPGHGPIGNKESFSTIIQYIKMIENLSTEMIKEGKDENKIDSIAIPPPFDGWWFDNFFRMNMNFMYKRVKNKESY